jgi:hypothetical protein
MDPETVQIDFEWACNLEYPHGGFDFCQSRLILAKPGSVGAVGELAFKISQSSVQVEPGLTCQHLYQSPSSPNARKSSCYQTSRNLYSYRLNYPAQLSMLIFRTSHHFLHKLPTSPAVAAAIIALAGTGLTLYVNHENTKSERLAGSVTEKDEA